MGRWMRQAVDPDATVRIGARLRAHRDATGVSPEDLAGRLGISRAALYRAEKGEIAKVELLGRIAVELGAGLDQLLGQGSEYFDAAPALFQRMADLESGAVRVTGVFSPASYLLTTPHYDQVLKEALFEQGQASPEQIGQALDALRRRRRGFGQGRMELRSIATVADLERFLAEGLSGRDSLPATIRTARRRHARAEVAAVAAQAVAPADGRVQFRLVEAPGAATSFEIVERAEGTWLIVSPFSLGLGPNITLGVGMVTASPEAIASHRAVTDRLWAEGISGEAAQARIHDILARAG